MSSTRVITVAIASLALAAPAGAAAHGRSHHHARHVSRSHHSRTRFERIDPKGVTTTSNPSASSAPSAPAPAPTVTDPGSQTGQSMSEAAGKVTSFQNGLLTLTLNDGSVVSGRVSDATKVECPTAADSTSEANDNASEPTETGDNESGQAPNDNSVGRDGDHGSGGSGHDGSGSDGSSQSSQQGSQGDAQGGEQENASPQCSASLVPGATVHEAELAIGSGGSTFSKIELA